MVLIFIETKIGRLSTRPTNKDDNYSRITNFFVRWTTYNFVLKWIIQN
jgi:hypothetical protein